MKAAYASTFLAGLRGLNCTLRRRVCRSNVEVDAPPQVEVLDSSCCSTTRSGEAGQHVERERGVAHAFHRAAGVAQLASVALGDVGNELHHV